MQRVSSSLRAVVAAFAVAAVVVVFAASSASATSATSSRSGFAFFARDISGAPAGSVTLVGAGAFDVSSGFSHSGGLFRCAETVGQGPLAGCQAGQGGRWSTDSLLASTGFKCTGDPAEALKTAIADARTAVLHANFFRAGDGNQPSFGANVIVAANDIAPDIGGVQNVWVQGVGCTNGFVHFSR